MAATGILFGLSAIWLIASLFKKDDNERSHCITRSAIYVAAALLALELKP